MTRIRLSLVQIACAALAVFVVWLPALAAEPQAAKDSPPAPLVYIAITGAPGDGEAALSAALAKRLAAVGVKEGTAQSADVYSVEGIVELRPADRGRQGIRISWTVFAPDGTALGGVTQMKLVRKGSLDKKWGAAADAAAREAAGEIAKLIPH